MSRKVLIDSLTDDDLKTLSKDLQVAQAPSKYAFNTQPTYICLYEAEGNNLYIPFAYGKKYPRPERSKFSQKKVHFDGTLRENQVIVKDEAIERLNSHGAVIIAAACGFGKTSLGIFIATKIKMKTLIICHRVVLINQWKESIKKFCPQATVQVLTAASKIQDADFYIMNATNVPKHSRDFYQDTGFLIVDECIPGKIPILLENGTKNIEDIHLQFQKGEDFMVQSYNEKTKCFETKKVLNTWKRPIEGKTLLEITFHDQFTVSCTENHRILTSTGYKYAKDLSAGDLVVSYPDRYLSIQKVKICDPGQEKFVYDLEVEDNHNFILADPTGKNGAVVHNCHLIMADKLSHCMRYLLPRYVLGLSATPYRTDGLDVLIDMYFGKHKIIRKLYRKHFVYRYNTGFKPEVKLNRMGKVDWGSVLESQCSNRERNETIIKLIQYFPDRVFLVLCKRVDQANYLVERLQEEKEDVTSLIGSNQEFQYSSRILIGTVQKTGVGFDHPRMNALILASDVEQYFVQYLGRVFRREDTEPIIFDLVDDYSLLLKHFRTRNAVYVEHGGIVKDFHKEFPDFG
jgi:superfamily II DNA or RNA helicase